MSSIEGTTVCIVEDDSVLSFLLREICKASGCTVLGTASNVAGASCMLDDRLPDILLLDYSLDDGDDGMELLARVKRDYPGMTSVLVTGWDICRIEARIDFVAPDYFLAKPVMPQHLAQLLNAIGQDLVPPRLAEAA